MDNSLKPIPRNLAHINGVETKGWALDRVHISRRPLNRFQYVFALCDPVTLTTFRPNTSWWAISVQSLAISVSAVLFLISDRQIKSHTKSQTRMIAILTRLPSAWVKTPLNIILCAIDAYKPNKPSRSPISTQGYHVAHQQSRKVILLESQLKLLTIDCIFRLLISYRAY